MRPTGGTRLELGHEQAGLRDVLVPVRAGLGIALLGLKVDVEQIVSDSYASKMNARAAPIITFLRKIPPALVGCSDNLACSRYSLSEIPRC
jgi:hypothetical protein